MFKLWMYFLLFISVCVTDSSITSLWWEGGKWSRIFVQMEIPLVPLSSKSFSERMCTTKITGTLWFAPESALASTRVIICCCSLFIMLIFATRRDSFFRALLQNKLLFNILSISQNLCYCDEEKNAYPTESNYNIIYCSSLYY